MEENGAIYDVTRGNSEKAKRKEKKFLVSLPPVCFSPLVLKRKRASILSNRAVLPSGRKKMVHAATFARNEKAYFRADANDSLRER